MSIRGCACSDLLTGISLNDLVEVTVKCELAEGETVGIEGFITRMTPVIQLDQITAVTNICCDSVCAVRRIPTNNTTAGSTEFGGFISNLPSHVVEDIRKQNKNNRRK